MEGNLGFQLTHASCDFEEARLDGIKLGMLPFGALQSDLCQRLYQDIGSRMEEEAERIGSKGVTGRAV